MFLCLIKHHAIKTWGVEVKWHMLIISALDGGEVWALYLGWFTLTIRIPGAYQSAGCFGPKIDWTLCRTEKSCEEVNHFSSCVHHITCLLYGLNFLDCHCSHTVSFIIDCFPHFQVFLKMPFLLIRIRNVFVFIIQYLIRMKDFTKLNTHHNLKVYGKLKYDFWHTVVHRIWRTVFDHSLHIFTLCTSQSLNISHA